MVLGGAPGDARAGLGDRRRRTSPSRDQLEHLRPPAAVSPCGWLLARAARGTRRRPAARPQQRAGPGRRRRPRRAGRRAAPPRVQPVPVAAAGQRQRLLERRCPARSQLGRGVGPAARRARAAYGGASARSGVDVRGQPGRDLAAVPRAVVVRQTCAPAPRRRWPRRRPSSPVIQATSQRAAAAGPTRCGSSSAVGQLDRAVERLVRRVRRPVRARRRWASDEQRHRSGPTGARRCRRSTARRRRRAASASSPRSSCSAAPHSRAGRASRSRGRGRCSSRCPRPAQRPRPRAGAAPTAVEPRLQ